ncbi:hypothetical protein [Mycoplasmopsis cricetuli]|uniref:hypothetical protein n=1 Tax=Mycoplasmopsis cricetuli TaxID=171283 RepID=UPI000471F00F|nr:hypothetical protein [Mycoplasmopsis cricetuli]
MKTKIYIDFEILNTKIYKLDSFVKIIPYLYTLGIKTEKGFKFETFYIRPASLYKKNPKETKHILLSHINNAIKNFAKIKLSKKINEVEFIGFNPSLERKILTSLFPGISVKNIYSGSEDAISLNNLLKELGNTENFEFNYLKSISQKNSKLYKAIEKSKKGYIAELGGAILYANYLKKNDVIEKIVGSKKINVKNVLDELKNYNLNDVKALEIIENNLDKVDEIIKQFKINKVLPKKDDIKNELSNQILVTSEQINITSYLLKMINWINDSQLKKVLESFANYLINNNSENLTDLITYLDKNKTKTKIHIQNFHELSIKTSCSCNCNQHNCK